MGKLCDMSDIALVSRCYIVNSFIIYCSALLY